jgi:MFS family permease
MSSSKYSIALYFIVFQSVSMMIIYGLDIFLESATSKKETGSVRGIYLTLASLAVVLSPLLIRFAAPNGEFRHLYVVSAFFLIPIYFIVIFSLKGFKDGPSSKIGLPIKVWLETSNIRRVTIVRNVLDLFYVFMVIFIPIYLRQYMHFTWTDLSMIFSIMLLPFVLFQIPVGRLADRWCGEKEIMTLGLFIIGCTLIIIPFIKTPSILLWAIVLFISRVGASLVEITCESSFFKHVDKRDTGLISIYRLSGPVATIFGPLIGAFSIALFPYEFMFFILAIIVLYAMKTSSRIKDTA